MNLLQKITKVTLVFCILFPCLLFLLSCEQPQDKKELNEKKQDTKKKSDEDTLYAVIMVGDIMMGTNYPYQSLPPSDGRELFSGVKEYLEIADVTIGNLEGTLLDSGGEPKECIEPENCASFRMPEHYAEYLSDAGFDIVSVANNHSNDMGKTGRESTINTLEKYEIKYAGYLTCTTTVFVKDGIRFGFTAFAPNTQTQDINNLKAAEKTILELKKKCDIVIVSFHGGAEGSGASRVDRMREYYLGEDRGNVYKFAHTVIDAGADIVFGHGPHVPRAMELYKNKIIAYSLGNFCTYAKFGLGGACGYAPILKVYIDKKGNFVKGRIFPGVQVKKGIPIIDEEYKACEFIKKMTELDFPETRLTIYDDGKIEPVE